MILKGRTSDFEGPGFDRKITGCRQEESGDKIKVVESKLKRPVGLRSGDLQDSRFVAKTPVGAEAQTHVNTATHEETEIRITGRLKNQKLIILGLQLSHRNCVRVYNSAVFAYSRCVCV